MESVWTWVLMGVALAAFLFVFFWKTDPLGDDLRRKS